jgi:hypothetical protein
LSEFCEAIVEHGYNKLPSRSNFCRWYADQCKQSISTRTVWLSMTQYYPGIKDDAMELISDVLVQGAALGKWNSTMVIFALKNWCHWSDRKEPEQESADELTVRVLSIAELTGEEAE